jgi:lysophospholipase L1-like esterase
VNTSDLPNITRYIALGDSICIDLYPALDVASRQSMEPPGGVGAASLLYKNQDWLWPEFEGHDLASLNSEMAFTNLTADGATTTDVLEDQVSALPGDTGPAVVTLTAGGNDLLWTFGSSEEEGQRALRQTGANLREIIRRVRAHFEGVTIIVGGLR